MAEIEFPSFMDQFELQWPRIESGSFAWSHPGQRFHPTPSQESGVVISRGDGFWTGVLQIFALPRYIIAAGLGDHISMWAAQLDIQANTTRIPHKRYNSPFLVGSVKLLNRGGMRGFYEYDIDKTAIPEDYRDDYSKISVGSLCQITAGKNVAKRVLRVAKVPIDGPGANRTRIRFFPNLLLPAVAQENDADATVIESTDTILTRALNDRPIVDPRSVNAAGPWIYGWREVLS